MFAYQSRDQHVVNPCFQSRIDFAFWSHEVLRSHCQSLQILSRATARSSWVEFQSQSHLTKVGAPVRLPAVLLYRASATAS
jgi:hypothetical protein